MYEYSISAAIPRAKNTSDVSGPPPSPEMEPATTSAVPTYTPNSTAPVPAFRSSMISFSVLKRCSTSLSTTTRATFSATMPPSE